MKPLVSIVIPFYGDADSNLLKRCINSLHQLRMQEDDCEVVVADDDGKGLGAARNKGLRKATGEYVLFLDADDYLLPGVSCCIAAIEKHKPDVCSFAMRRVKEEMQRPLRKATEWSLYPSGAEYMNQNSFTGNACRHFFRSQFLKEGNICFAESCYHEDEDFMVKVFCKAAATIVTNECFYGYYINPSSITLKRSAEMRQQRLDDFLAMLHRTKEFHQLIEANYGTGSIEATSVRRRLSFLTIDYIRQLWRNRCKHIKQRTAHLSASGFLPLPSNNYSAKYTLTRTAINLFF